MCPARGARGIGVDTVSVAAIDPRTPDLNGDPHHMQNRLRGGTSDAQDGQYIGGLSLTIATVQPKAPEESNPDLLP
jgi:hypothetical protein